MDVFVILLTRVFGCRNHGDFGPISIHSFGGSDSRLAEQGRQCMAVDSQHLCGHAKCACSGDSLRKHSEEEVGSELCLHGILCLRSCPPVLGRLGLQDVLRREASSHLGKGRDHTELQIPSLTSWPSFKCTYVPQWHRGSCPAHPILPHGHLGLLPVRVCSDHTGVAGWICAWAHEFPGVDGVRALVVDMLLYCGRIQHLGWGVPVAVGCDWLCWWLCHPSILRCGWLHSCLLGTKTFLLHYFVFSSFHIIFSSCHGDHRFSIELCHVFFYLCPLPCHYLHYKKKVGLDDPSQMIRVVGGLSQNNIFGVVDIKVILTTSRKNGCLATRLIWLVSWEVSTKTIFLEVLV